MMTTMIKMFRSFKVYQELCWFSAIGPKGTLVKSSEYQPQVFASVPDRVRIHETRIGLGSGILGLFQTKPSPSLANSNENIQTQ